ncbi:holo-ACP synthase [Streptomyces achromogenes]|uniref:holo-ACP synthase n=1 Tax=Streptomyces achromogenes TaxID=67255 RepID=UPI0004C80041|nr:holo-ACP synthase [Streptomyces achromogenes]
MPPGRVGIDLVPFARVSRLLTPEAEPVLPRMLSQEELGLCVTRTGPDIPGIAGRLAAKEAVFKLFHAAGQPMPWLGIEILKENGGRPVVRLSGRAARLARDARVGHIEVSIAHDDPFAVAVAFCDTATEREAHQLESAYND